MNSSQSFLSEIVEKDAKSHRPFNSQVRKTTTLGAEKEVVVVFNRVLHPLYVIWNIKSNKNETTSHNRQQQSLDQRTTNEVHDINLKYIDILKRCTRTNALLTPKLSYNYVTVRDVKTGFFGKPVFGCWKPVLNRFSVLLTFIKNILLYKANNFNFMYDAL